MRLLLPILLALACAPDQASRLPPAVSSKLSMDHRPAGLLCLPEGFAVAGPFGGHTPLTLREEQPARPAAYSSPYARVVECGADSVLCPCRPAAKGAQ